MTHSSDADRAQAAVFCEEIHRHIALLDARAGAEAQKLRALLARFGPDRNRALIDAAQSELRSMAIEKRALVNMLDALGHAHPCVHGSGSRAD